MRRFLIAAFVLAAPVASAGAANLGATGHPFRHRADVVTTLAPSASAVRFGVGATLSGWVSPGAAGEVVTIVARRYADPTATVLTTTTGGGGRWSARVEPAIQTTYQARCRGMASKRVTIGVRPSLTVVRLASGLLGVRVEPARRFVGRDVELQRRVAGRWRTVERVALAGPVGSAVFPRSPAGGVPLRVAMSVNAAGRGFRGAHTGPLEYRAHVVSLAPSVSRVVYGHMLTLAGAVSSGRPGERIEILAWRYGASAPRMIATVGTGIGGHWSLWVGPSVRTTFTARWGTSSSAPRVVGVQPRVAVTVRGDHRVRVRVTAARMLRGRLVQLQQRTVTGAWTTVARRRLGGDSIAVFPPLAPRGAMLRIALSVNQAGAGLLGVHSDPFVDRSV